jgi:uncharacterized protein
MKTKKGDWIMTHTGLKIYPLDPSPEEICFEDIAHALSNICRYTGHCSNFYSVAQHSVYVSVYSSHENALWGLLHDASEAYLCDIARPVKRSDYLKGYREVEERMMKVIAQKFCLSWPIPDEIKNLDNAFIMTEARDLGFDTTNWKKYADPLNIKIIPILPEKAKQSFYDWFAVISNRKASQGI